jgi:GT2 family glycosyltransferase
VGGTGSIEGECLPNTSLIICSRERPQLLQDCVTSVFKGEAVPAEMLIVDDSDRENSALASMAALPCKVRYFWRGGRGLSSALNLAIRLASHEILVFCQDDNEVDPAWFGSITQALRESNGHALITGAVRAGRAESRHEFVANTNPMPERAVYRGRLPRDVLYAQNMAMFKAAVKDIGLFDERLGPGTRFPASEDSDFAYRALQRGYSIVYEPSAVVRHRAWRSGEDWLRFRWDYGFARGGFYAKYMFGDRHMLGRLWRDLRQHLVPVPGLLLHQRRKATGHLAFTGGLVLGAVWWALNGRANDRRSVGEREPPL